MDCRNNSIKKSWCIKNMYAVKTVIKNRPNIVWLKNQENCYAGCTCSVVANSIFSIIIFISKWNAYFTRYTLFMCLYIVFEVPKCSLCFVIPCELFKVYIGFFLLLFVCLFLFFFFLFVWGFFSFWCVAVFLALPLSLDMYFDHSLYSFV